MIVSTPLACIQKSDRAFLTRSQSLPFWPRLRYTAAHHSKGGLHVMEADLVAQRCALFCLSRRHPEWTYAELAAHVGRWESWVNTWVARLK